MKVRIIFIACLFVLGFQSNIACASEKKVVNQNKQISSDKQIFLNSISRNFRRNYFPLPDYCIGVAKIKFLLSANGHPSKIQIVKSAVNWKTKERSATNDEAMVVAVKNLTNLPTMPNEMKDPSEILLTLDGNGKGPMKITASIISERASNGK